MSETLRVSPPEVVPDIVDKIVLGNPEKHAPDLVRLKGA